jgi:hypothetical protein
VAPPADRVREGNLLTRLSLLPQAAQPGQPDQKGAAAKRHGLVATDRRVEIVGLCADCR